MFQCLLPTGKKELWQIKGIWHLLLSASLAPNFHLPENVFSCSLLFQTALIIPHVHTSLPAGIWFRQTLLQQRCPFCLGAQNYLKCHLHSCFQIIFNFPRKCFHIILPSTSQIKTPGLLLILPTLADSRGRGRLLHFIANNLSGGRFHFLTLGEEQCWSFSCSSAHACQTSPGNVLLTSHALGLALGSCSHGLWNEQQFQPLLRRFLKTKMSLQL